MFNKGDIVIGVKGNGYGCTNEYALMVVLRSSSKYFDAFIIAHDEQPNEIGKKYDVYNRDDYFSPISIEEYLELFPDAEIINEDRLNDVLRRYEVSIDTASLYQNNKKVSYELSSELRTSLMEEMRSLLTTYGYTPTDKGLNAIIDTWAISKANLIRLFENHPNYNGKFQIVFDADYERELDIEEIKSFTNYLYTSKEVEQLILKDYNNDKPFSYEECHRYKRINKELCELFIDYPNIKTINGLTHEEVDSRYNKWRKLEVEINCVSVQHSGRRVTIESYDAYQKFRYIIECFYNYYSNVLNSEISDVINKRFPDFKAKKGQKTSRALNKLCAMLGVDKISEYNQRFAKYSDAINPLTIKRYTILSVHPVDFFTMSFGNSWSSCHTIDKKNIRKMPNSYEGRYSGGTESYMLDRTSMVLYTVDKSYEGTEYELQPKINRNMFHYGHDKLIQGRVYPQSNDSNGSAIYKMFRETVQKLISECKGGANSWLNIKGTVECTNVTYTQGVHYPDYLNFDSCNVSYYNKEKNMRKITIGRNHICPSCGVVHDRSRCIECEDCY